MKAVCYHRYGDSDVLQYEDIERPLPGAGQVLVKVAATSFNPVDAVIRSGNLTDVFAIALPHGARSPNSATGHGWAMRWWGYCQWRSTCRLRVLARAHRGVYRRPAHGAVG